MVVSAGDGVVAVFGVDGNRGEGVEVAEFGERELVVETDCLGEEVRGVESFICIDSGGIEDLFADEDDLVALFLDLLDDLLIEGERQGPGRPGDGGGDDDEFFLDFVLGE